jgi:hypothetical protein
MALVNELVVAIVNYSSLQWMMVYDDAREKNADSTSSIKVLCGEWVVPETEMQ